MVGPALLIPSERLKLYVKTWCPWCVVAKRELEQRGLAYEEINVERDRAGFREMMELSGQSLTPTLVIGDQVLPDFGPEDLEPFLAENGVLP